MRERVPTEVYYRFACSTLVVSGKREYRVEWDSGRELVLPSADVALTVEADSRRPIVRLPTIDGSHDVSVKLTPDGRLAAISGTTRGLLGDVIEASVAVGSFAAGLVGAVVAPRLPPLPPVLPASPASPRLLAEGDPDRPEVATDPEAAAKTPAARWQALDPDGDATRLALARTTLASLHTATVDRAAEMADADKPGAAMRKLLAVRTAIAAVQAEIDEINRRREAWFNALFQTVEDHEFTFATDEAFQLKTADGVPPVTIRVEELQDGTSPAQAVLAALNVAVVEVRDSDADRPPIDDAEDIVKILQDANRGELPPGIYFRVPRPATLALYQDSPDRTKSKQRKLKLQSVERHWVVDADCRYGSIPLKGDDDLSASATFTAGGFLEGVSLDAKSKLESLIEAFKNAPAGVAGGIGHAKTTIEGWDALRAAKVNRQLQALESQKKQLEMAVAMRGLEADASQVETLQMLKDKLERLKTTKDLNPKDPDAKAVADQERVALAARFRVELQIARTERQLAAYKDE